MSTQQSKFRNALLTTVALLSVGLPLGSLLPGNTAQAHETPEQKSSHHHPHKPPVLIPPGIPPVTPPSKPPVPTVPTYMESYNFNYQYANKPIINGGSTPENYLGSGFAPVGTYKSGQTINIADNFGRTVGTYTIGSVNDQTPYDAQKLNKVTVIEYDYDLASAPIVTRRIVGTGLDANSGGTNGLGSETGTLIGLGLEGSNVSFSNQQLAIVPHHF